MPTKYERLIRDYCASHGIAVPGGFARHPPSRYAILRTDLLPPKLTATTWFKAADVLYYIEQLLLPELGDTLAQSIRILDFQDGDELAYDGAKRLKRIATIALSDDRSDA